MTVPNSNPSFWRRGSRLATFVTIFASLAFVARAQAPYALFQNSAIVGSGNTITATQVPVVLGSGVTVYVNLTMQFDVDSSGNLTISSGFPQILPAPTLLTSSFVPGTYVGPSTILSGGMIITITGPGVTDGGATIWTLTTPSGANEETYPGTATWYVGPLASSPYAARLKSAGITSTAWSYGLLGASFGDTFDPWPANGLIGVSQVGNTITFASFSSAGKDSNLPFAQVTYTLKP